MSLSSEKTVIKVTVCCKDGLSLCLRSQNSHSLDSSRLRAARRFLVVEVISVSALLCTLLHLLLHPQLRRKLVSVLYLFNGMLGHHVSKSQLSLNSLASHLGAAAVVAVASGSRRGGGRGRGGDSLWHRAL